MARKPKVNADEYEEKWGRRLKQSTQDIERGVRRVDEAPTSRAADRIDKMRQNFLASLDSGKTERALRRVSLSDWQEATTGKGLQRIAAGVDGARDKVRGVARQLLDYEEQLMQEVDDMPDVTLDDSINKMVAFVRGMADFEVE